jgi:hypothetical protein
MTTNADRHLSVNLINNFTEKAGLVSVTNGTGSLINPIAVF